MQQADDKKVPVEKKIRFSTIVYAFLISIVLIFTVMCVLAYGTNTALGGRIAGYLSRAIPFPAAFVGYSNVIYLKDVESNLASLQQFYAAEDFTDSGLRVDFTTEDGKKRLLIKEREILNKMVEDKAIEILAEEKGITISKKDLDDAVAKKIATSGTASEVKADLLKKYGWTLEDFKSKIVLPEARKEMLSYVVSGEVNGMDKAKERIQQAQRELQAGKGFTEVVAAYSEGDSKNQGGEIGWMKKEQVLPELQGQIFAATPPEKNSILESSIGFHIVEIENRKKEDNEDVVQIRQIFVRKVNFADWLVSEMNKMRIMIPLSGFVWDKEASRVDFRNEEMRKFEKESRAKMEGDASIMF